MLESRTGNYMAENEPTLEQLRRRRDEINRELTLVNEDLRVELDTDPEEQAIQIEQNEVSVTREDNLRRELVAVEDQLAELEG
ncbi:MAG: hypothetical protein ABI539_06535 [Acidobacteriota bacterium]